MICPTGTSLAISRSCAAAGSCNCGKCKVKDRTKSDLPKQDCQQEKKLWPIVEYFRDVQADRWQARSSLCGAGLLLLCMLGAKVGTRNMQFLVMMMGLSCRVCSED